MDPRDQYQLDGDTVGECATLVAEIDPGALIVRVPVVQRRSLTTAELTTAEDPAPEPVSVST